MITNKMHNIIDQYSIGSAMSVSRDRRKVLPLMMAVVAMRYSVAEKYKMIKIIFRFRISSHKFTMEITICWKGTAFSGTAMQVNRIDEL